jgi:hypothetical protein
VCDNTLAYDVVLASGELIRASSNEHADLFWALKGGGGNFGVVTSITYRMYPITTVISGMVLHPLADARDVLRFYRDFTMAGLPDELIVYAGALTTPDGHPVLALIPVWCGDDLAEGERVLEPLRQFGSPIADLIRSMPYQAVQQMIDGVAPFGLRSYWKSRFLRNLPDDAIDTFLRFAESRTSPRTLAILEHAHGAVSRVGDDATPFPARDAAFDFVLISMWENPAEDAVHVDWTRQFYSAMQPGRRESCMSTPWIRMTWHVFPKLTARIMRDCARSKRPTIQRTAFAVTRIFSRILGLLRSKTMSVASSLTQPRNCLLKFCNGRSFDFAALRSG